MAYLAARRSSRSTPISWPREDRSAHSGSTPELEAASHWNFAPTGAPGFSTPEGWEDAILVLEAAGS